MRHIRGLFATWLVLMLSTVGICGAAPAEGQMTWGLHFSPTPGWFDPSELAGTVTSYHTLYALHDAMIRPSPSQPMSPSLARVMEHIAGRSFGEGQGLDGPPVPGAVLGT